MLLDRRWRAILAELFDVGACRDGIELLEGEATKRAPLPEEVVGAAVGGAGVAGADVGVHKLRKAPICLAAKVAVDGRWLRDDANRGGLPTTAPRPTR